MSRRIGLRVRMMSLGPPSDVHNQMWWQRGREIGDIRQTIWDRSSGALKAMTKRLGYFLVN